MARVPYLADVWQRLTRPCIPKRRDSQEPVGHLAPWHPVCSGSEMSMQHLCDVEHGHAIAGNREEALPVRIGMRHRQEMERRDVPCVDHPEVDPGTCWHAAVEHALDDEGRSREVAS